MVVEESVKHRHLFNVFQLPGVHLGASLIDTLADELKVVSCY